MFKDELTTLEPLKLLGDNEETDEGLEEETEEPEDEEDEEGEDNIE